MNGKVNELNVNDKWIYHGVTYEVERDEETRLFSKVGFVDAVLSPSFPTFLTFR